MAEDQNLVDMILEHDSIGSKALQKALPQQQAMAAANKKYLESGEVENPKPHSDFNSAEARLQEATEAWEQALYNALPDDAYVNGPYEGNALQDDLTNDKFLQDALQGANYLHWAKFYNNPKVHIYTDSRVKQENENAAQKESDLKFQALRHHLGIATALDTQVQLMTGSVSHYDQAQVTPPQIDPTLDTGHYDDGHAFGWKKPVVAGSILAALAAFVAAAVLAFSGGGNQSSNTAPAVDTANGAQVETAAIASLPPSTRQLLTTGLGLSDDQILQIGSYSVLPAYTGPSTLTNNQILSVLTFKETITSFGYDPSLFYPNTGLRLIAANGGASVPTPGDYEVFTFHLKNDIQWSDGQYVSNYDLFMGVYDNLLATYQGPLSGADSLFELAITPGLAPTLSFLYTPAIGALRPNSDQLGWVIAQGDNMAFLLPSWFFPPTTTGYRAGVTIDDVNKPQSNSTYFTQSSGAVNYPDPYVSFKVSQAWGRFDPSLANGNPQASSSTRASGGATQPQQQSGAGVPSSGTGSQPSSGVGAAPPVLPSQGVLSGDYIVFVKVLNNPAGHERFVAMPAQIAVNVFIVRDTTTGAITITLKGPAPWVNLDGTAQFGQGFTTTGGGFSASGFGTVAGYQNVKVEFSGSVIADTGLSGVLKMGTNKALPTEREIDFTLTGTKK